MVELGTSVSALVQDFLRSTDHEQADGGRVETAAELRGRLLDEVLADFDARGVGLDPRDHLTRGELYDRNAARVEAVRECSARSGSGECGT